MLISDFSPASKGYCRRAQALTNYIWPTFFKGFCTGSDKTSQGRGPPWLIWLWPTYLGEFLKLSIILPDLEFLDRCWVGVSRVLAHTFSSPRNLCSMLKTWWIIWHFGWDLAPLYTIVTTSTEPFNPVRTAAFSVVFFLGGGVKSKTPFRRHDGECIEVISYQLSCANPVKAPCCLS